MNSLEQFMGKGEDLTFEQFREFIVNRYEKEFNEHLEIKAVIAEINYEGPERGLMLLYSVYNDVVSELDIYVPGYEEYIDFLQWLDESAMYDYFMEIRI